MELTNRQFLIAVTAASFIATSAGLSFADAQSSAKQAPAASASAERFVYFPAQYPLNVSNDVSEHIQAF